MATLKQKMQTLRDELDVTKETLSERNRQLEAEKARMDEYENEVHSLSRRVKLLEDTNDQLETRLATALEQLRQATDVVDEQDRSRRTLESRQNRDDEKISMLEEQLRQATAVASEYERKYEEVARRLVITESDLDRAEERAAVAESKARTLDNDLHFISNSLKSVEISEHTLADKEESYQATITELNRRLADAENTVEILSRELKTKQYDLDRMEDALEESKMQCNGLREEMNSYLQTLSSL